MKNVIFLSYLNLWSLQNKKGAPSFYKTIEAFINDGWNVTLINPDYKNGETPHIEKLNNYTFKPFFYPYVKYKKVGFIARVLHAIQGNIQMYILAKKALKEFSSKALIYSYEVHGVKSGKKISMKYKLPFVTRFQGTVLAPLKYSFKNIIRKFPHYGAIKTEADITIMTNDGTKGDQVLRDLKNNSRIIKFWRNGVDIDKARAIDFNRVNQIRKACGLSREDKVLLTVSRLAAWKKVDRAIYALSVANKKISDLKLVVVGDGDEKKNLIEYAKSLNMEDDVIFVGAVEQEEVKSYLDMGDIFLSLYDLSNVGNPLLEAMSCGKPIITLDVGDTNQIIHNRKNGIILGIDQLDMIPDAIVELVQDDNFSKKLGENAKTYASENFWTWRDRMNAELELVNELYNKWDFS